MDQNKKNIMRKPLLLSITLLVAQQVFACTSCNKELQNAIYNSTFVPNLLTLFSAFIVLTICVVVLSVLSTKKHAASVLNSKNNASFTPVPLTTASTILGIGIGGFIDGIAFHQVLQWHEMLSNKIPPTDLLTKSVNMFWDGIFHAFCLVVVLVGIVFLWKAMKRADTNKSGNLLAGGLLYGWGLFNIVEGIIDHQILKLHNVREITNNVEGWNYGFLIASVLMIIAAQVITNKSNALSKT
jgi:uncharacterized membrane protein